MESLFIQRSDDSFKKFTLMTGFVVQGHILIILDIYQVAYVANSLKQKKISQPFIEI